MILAIIFSIFSCNYTHCIGRLCKNHFTLNKYLLNIKNKEIIVLLTQAMIGITSSSPYNA